MPCTLPKFGPVVQLKPQLQLPFAAHAHKSHRSSSVAFLPDKSQSHFRVGLPMQRVMEVALDRGACEQVESVRLPLKQEGRSQGLLDEDDRPPSP
ncbi:hypothetical protein [Mumia zhuanghuii]|uniref:Uncharacterized protein n=1 Tax=Mumia zhuanghuii TaxID=2585211 RepID=A0A5C4MBC7_9ACTN|nr:hypothetical protein [Mumia zhuanghuii]TNC32523.1 hypothetical protein FHE65_30355 [Mumia zhuanghuii]